MTLEQILVDLRRLEEETASVVAEVKHHGSGGCVEKALQELREARANLQVARGFLERL